MNNYDIQIRRKDCFIDNEDILYKLRSVEAMIIARNELFLKSSRAQNENDIKAYEKYIDFYNLKIKETLKL